LDNFVGFDNLPVVDFIGFDKFVDIDFVDFDNFDDIDFVILIILLLQILLFEVLKCNYSKIYFFQKKNSTSLFRSV
jgi:hypothetical protein